MQAFPDSANRLIEEFSQLPGIGKKTAQRLAFHLLKSESKKAYRLADALKEIKTIKESIAISYPMECIKQ